MTKTLAQRRPAETATGLVGVLTALLLALGFDEQGTAVIVAAVSGLPAAVTTIVDWWRAREDDDEPDLFE